MPITFESSSVKVFAVDKYEWEKHGALIGEKNIAPVTLDIGDQSTCKSRSLRPNNK